MDEHPKTSTEAPGVPRVGPVGWSIVYSGSGGTGWELPVSRLAVIGEQTNGNGPFLDDYFLVLIAKDGGRFCASFYSRGRDEFLADLGWIVKADLRWGLVATTDLASRVIWPSELRDRPLFDFVPRRPRSTRERIRATLCSTVDSRLTDRVRTYLSGGETA